MLRLKFSLETMKGTTGQKQRAKQTKNTLVYLRRLVVFLRKSRPKDSVPRFGTIKNKERMKQFQFGIFNFRICREFWRSAIPFSMERPFGKKQRKHVSHHRRFPKAQLTFLETERRQVSLV